MANMTAVLFDDLGDMYKIDNLPGMLNEAEMDAELIITLYKKTVEGHMITMANEELVQLGYLDGSKNRPYNPEGVEYGIDTIKEWLTNQYGVNNVAKIDSEIEHAMAFLKNKPELPKKRTKK